MKEERDILEDVWSEKERKMQYNLRRIAETKTREGKNVRVRYGKVQI